MMSEIRESVIFMVRREEQILCEWRQFRDVMRHCILGGKVEQIDYEANDFRNAAVIREAQEEIGIIVKSCQYLSSFEYKNYPFHLMLVESWVGEIPEFNNDNKNRLNWVDQHELAASITLEPLKQAVDKFLYDG